MDKIPVLYLRQASEAGGGADTMIANTVAHLNRTHFTIILAYLRKHTESIEAVHKTLDKFCVSYIDLPGISLFDPFQFIKIVSVIKKRHVQVIHCHDPKCDLYGYILGFIFPNVKLVSTLHGWIPRRKRSKFYAALDKFLVRNFDAVIAVSDQILETVAKRHIKNIHVIKNSVDTNEWRLVDAKPRNPGVSKVGFVGRISHEKGPLDFVRVAKKVLAQNTPVEFYVAGVGPEESAMKKLIHQLGIENCFHFEGQLNANQLKSFYQKLDVFLLTSHTEGVPLAILEAGAMETPVVATNVGGVGEVIMSKQNGLLAPKGDIELLAKHVLHLLEDRNWAHELGSAGRSIVEREFSIEANVKKIQDVYEKIVMCRTRVDI